MAHKPTLRPPIPGVPELAALMGNVSETAREHLRAGKIPGAFRLGRRWCIPQRVLDDLAEGRLS